MLGPVIAGLLAGVLAAGTLAPAARAGTVTYLAYAERAAGMPATSDPARTIESATGVISDGTRVWVQVDLAAEPEVAHSAEVHAVFGTVDGAGGCTPVTDLVAATAGSSTVELAGEIQPRPAGASGCTYVAVTEAGASSVLDRIDGRGNGTVVVDPPASLRFGGYRHRDVPVDRWSWVLVRVRLDQSTDLLRVSGRPTPGVRTRDVVERDLAAGPVWVRVPVKLLEQRERKLVLRASTSYASASSSVRLEPRR